MTLESPWMTPAEACVYLRFVKADGSPDLDRLYHARTRLGLPASRLGGGRTLRFHRAFVDDWMLGREGRRALRLLEKGVA